MKTADSPYSNEGRCLIFKDEDITFRRQRIGPLWIKQDAMMENYKNSDLPSVTGKGFTPLWFTVAQARQIARTLGVPLYIV